MEVSLPASVQAGVYIDPDRCSFSCVCVDRCPRGVFVKKDGRVYPYNSHICCCFRCNEFCQNHAITTRWIVRA